MAIQFSEVLSRCVTSLIVFFLIPIYLTCFLWFPVLFATALPHGLNWLNCPWEKEKSFAVKKINKITCIICIKYLFILSGDNQTLLDCNHWMTQKPTLHLIGLFKIGVCVYVDQMQFHWLMLNRRRYQSGVQGDASNMK